MATLSTLIGTPFHELPELQRYQFIDDLRELRQTFTDGAYEFRKSKRKTAKPPNLKIEALMEEDFDL